MVRSAPEVCSMSARVMRVVGVAESDGGEGDAESLDLNALDGWGYLEGNVHDGVGAGGYGERLGDGGEAWGDDGETVNADGGLGQLKFAFGVGFGAQSEGGIGGLKGDLCAGDGTVLGIVDHAVHGGEDGGEGGEGCGKK